jgi:hypothetical protein
VLGGIGLQRDTAGDSRHGSRPTTEALGVTRWAAGCAVLLRRSRAENGSRPRMRKPAFHSGLRAVRWPSASCVCRGSPFSEGRNRPPGLRMVIWRRLLAPSDWAIGRLYDSSPGEPRYLRFKAISLRLIRRIRLWRWLRPVIRMRTKRSYECMSASKRQWTATIQNHTGWQVFR